jgi:predicted GNAT family acetyltransferase
MSELEIKHLIAEQCFVVDLAGTQARLEYQFTPALSEGKPGRINFSHTYVPPELRGQGVAEKLVRTGLQWAQQEQFEIRASCWYVAKFLR